MKSANRYINLSAALIVLSFAITGCVSIARATMFKIVDVSDKPELHGDLTIGDIYTMETDLFLQDDQDIGKYPILVTPGELGVVGGMEYSGPNSVDDYANERAAWPQVLGVVNRGTRLRVSAILKVNSAFDAGWTFPVVTIVDGEFNGTDVNIVDLVKKCSDYDPNKVVTHCVDHRLLSRLNSGDEGQAQEAVRERWYNYTIGFDVVSAAEDADGSTGGLSMTNVVIAPTAQISATLGDLAGATPSTGTAPLPDRDVR